MQNRNLDDLASTAGQVVSKFLERDAALMIELLAPIEDAAPQAPATTARGALFQLLVAAGDLGELVCTEQWDPEALHQRHLRIEALTVSALNFFAREHGLDRDMIGGAYFSRRGYVPQLLQPDVAA